MLSPRVRPNTEVVPTNGYYSKAMKWEGIGDIDSLLKTIIS